MKIIATTINTRQVGVDEWMDFLDSKEFNENSTIKEIDEWAKTLNGGFFTVKFSSLVESK